MRARIAVACAAAGRDPRDGHADRGHQDPPGRRRRARWSSSACSTSARAGPGGAGQARRARRELGRRAARELRWHFVGRLQTNKARSVASYATPCTRSTAPKLAARARRRPSRRARPAPLDVFVQVSLDGDPAARRRAGRRARCRSPTHVADRPQLRLRGVMAVPPHGRRPRRRVRPAGRAVAPGCAREHPQADAISAGMSDDLEAAVRNGSTHVRVGTALLGRREPDFRLASPSRFSSPQVTGGPMPGAMHRMGVYLGLVEDDEYADADGYAAPAPERAAGPSRRVRRRRATSARSTTRRERRIRAPRASTPSREFDRDGSTARGVPGRADVPDHRAAPAHLQRGAHDRRAASARAPR